MPAKKAAPAAASKPRRPTEQQFGNRYPITCDGQVLVIRKQLSFLPPDVCAATLEWLHAHGLTENELPIGRPITRGTGQVTYWARPNGALEATIRRAKAPAGTRLRDWPAPFPQILLDQPRPTTCPTCGHDKES